MLHPKKNETKVNRWEPKIEVVRLNSNLRCSVVPWENNKTAFFVKFQMLEWLLLYSYRLSNPFSKLQMLYHVYSYRIHVQKPPFVSAISANCWAQELQVVPPQYEPDLSWDAHRTKWRVPAICWIIFFVGNSHSTSRWEQKGEILCWLGLLRRKLTCSPGNQWLEDNFLLTWSLFREHVSFRGSEICYPLNQKKNLGESWWSLGRIWSLLWQKWPSTVFGWTLEDQRGPFA